MATRIVEATSTAPEPETADQNTTHHPGITERPLRTDASPELLAAQVRLLELRAERGASRPGPQRFSSARRAPTFEVSSNWSLRNATLALQQRREELRPKRGGVGDLLSLDLTGFEQPLVADLSGLRANSCSPTAVIVHPTMLLAMLRQHEEAPARLWFLLRAIDIDGRGCVTVDEARARLATKGSPWRFCGWRRLRQLLAEGEGTYWTRDDQGVLWLHAAYRVAQALGCYRVQGWAVELSVTALLGGIQGVRASFYAAFHSGRENRPISRDTLHTLTGLAPRTQLDYDRLARVRARRNVAIGERHSTQAHQERAWQRGRGVFRFVDTEGKQGRPGGEYVAWHLPNSYEGPHTRRSRGHRKRLNRKLADLVTNGIPGNSEAQIERVFWPDGSAAAKGFNRAPGVDAYWQGSTMRGDGRLWGVFGRLERGK